MRKFLILLLLIAASNSQAHVPVVALPIKGTPIASYFLGRSDISRAVYSELSQPNDIFVAHFSVSSSREKTSVQILTPVCEKILRYEEFQPNVLVIRGDLPWKRQGETNTTYISRLKRAATVTIASNFARGQRPKFYEEFGKIYYWVGGEWKGRLKKGLHALVVYDERGQTGTFSLGLNEKEAWTPDLYAYVEELMPTISKGLCNPKGFTGRMKP